jgi:uncharacterized membrane protein YhaH (DUF805 family)
MEDEQQPELFQSSTQASRGPYWIFAIPILFVIAIGTFFISLSMMGSDPSAGALNGLGSIFAGIFAVGAFIGTLVILLIVRVARR